MALHTNMRMVLLSTVLKLTDTQTAKMLMALGVGTFFGGIAAKRSIKALGGAGQPSRARRTPHAAHTPFNPRTHVQGGGRLSSLCMS